VLLFLAMTLRNIGRLKAGIFEIDEQLMDLGGIR